MKNLGNIVNDNDIVTKKYVDDEISNYINMVDEVTEISYKFVISDRKLYLEEV